MKAEEPSPMSDKPMGELIWIAGGDILRTLKAAVEGLLTSDEWQAWCDHHVLALREHMSANRFLRLKWCPNREAVRLLDAYGVTYKQPLYRYEECHFCGARMLVAVPGETTVADIRLFARRCKIPELRQAEEEGWVHPGEYCPNGCTERLDRYAPSFHSSPSVPDNPNPVMTARPNTANWVKCPCCGVHFALYNVRSWDGQRHLTCGQRLLLDTLN